ncbi:hypothetical protein QTP88_027364, partial [Uroleucon formosanum]
FVDNYADTIAPLTNRLKQGTKWSWTETEQAAFTKIKRALEIRAGAVLFERGNSLDERRIIAYASKKFSDTYKRYAAVERECLAIIWATDNQNTNSKLTRWALQLANLDYKTTHVPGVQNEAPDMLSRNPTTGPPVDEELLVGVPTSPLTDTTSSPADNLTVILAIPRYDLSPFNY